MKVYKTLNNEIIADRVEMAQCFFSRAIGLISRKTLNKGEGLVIKPCFSVHTFFMKFAIDILFISGKNKVIALYENVSPWRILPLHPKSFYVIELAAGSISDKNIQKDDTITLIS